MDIDVHVIYVVFLGKTLYSHSASLHRGVYMGTSELSGKPDETLGMWGGGEGVTFDGLQDAWQYS